MAKLTLTTPVRVGDLINGAIIAELTLVSFAVNWQPGGVTFSIVLQDLTSNWAHTVTLTAAEGTAALAALRAAFPTFENLVLGYLANQGKLPPGTVS